MFERPDIEPAPAERERSPEELLMRQNMQRALMYDYIKARGMAPDDDITSALVEWIDAYAPEFDRVLTALEQENSELVSEWQDHPERVMQLIRDRMSSAARGETEIRKAA